MEAMNSKQLEEKAEEFVSEYRNASDDEISRIVAGIVSIIDGNEAAYENIKNQKWFQRIWYGLTQKNKTTVREMQAKRDQLTKYTIQILVKMNNMMNEHSQCIFDLYRALAIVRRDMNSTIDEIDNLAHRLNDKINDIENYQLLINDIRNNKFDKNTPLMSLIDIMSLIDSRTAKDERKLKQLRETMETMGFDFSKNTNIISFSQDVLSIPEDKVGRILLFCQSFSHRSRFLAYTSYLMENYYYLGETDKRIVRESGETIKSSLFGANLTENANCVVGELFNDIIEALPESFDQTEFIDIVDKPLSAANYFSSKTNKELNIVVAGITGSGKSTLINSIFGWNVAATGRGKPITMKFEKYSNDKDNITIYDTKGFQINSSENDQIVSDIKSVIQNKGNFVLWFCINSLSSRYENNIVVELQSLSIPIIIVLTNSVEEDDELEKEIILSNHKNGLSDIPVLSVLAKDYINKEIVVNAFGLEELIDKSIEVARL